VTSSCDEIQGVLPEAAIHMCCQVELSYCNFQLVYINILQVQSWRIENSCKKVNAPLACNVINNKQQKLVFLISSMVFGSLANGIVSIGLSLIERLSISRNMNLVQITCLSPLYISTMLPGTTQP